MLPTGVKTMQNPHNIFEIVHFEDVGNCPKSLIPIDLATSEYEEVSVEIEKLNEKLIEADLSIIYEDMYYDIIYQHIKPDFDYNVYYFLIKLKNTDLNTYCVSVNNLVQNNVIKDIIIIRNIISQYNFSSDKYFDDATDIILTPTGLYTILELTNSVKIKYAKEFVTTVNNLYQEYQKKLNQKLISFYNLGNECEDPCNGYRTADSTPSNSPIINFQVPLMSPTTQSLNYSRTQLSPSKYMSPSKSPARSSARNLSMSPDMSPTIAIPVRMPPIRELSGAYSQNDTEKTTDDEGGKASQVYLPAAQGSTYKSRRPLGLNMSIPNTPKYITLEQSLNERHRLSVSPSVYKAKSPMRNTKLIDSILIDRKTFDKKIRNLIKNLNHKYVNIITDALNAQEINITQYNSYIANYRQNPLIMYISNEIIINPRYDSESILDLIKEDLGISKDTLA